MSNLPPAPSGESEDSSRAKDSQPSTAPPFLTPEMAAQFEKWERETQEFRDVSSIWLRVLEAALQLEPSEQKLVREIIEALQVEPLRTSHRLGDACRDFFYALLGDERFMGFSGLMACSPEIAAADPAIGAYFQASNLAYNLGRQLGRQWPCQLD